MGLLDSLRRPGRSRSSSKVDKDSNSGVLVIPDTKFMPSTESLVSEAIAFPSTEQSLPTMPGTPKLRNGKRRRSFKEIFSFPSSSSRTSLAADGEGQDAYVPPVPALPDLVHSPSGSSTATTASPVSYVSSLNRQTSKEGVAGADKQRRERRQLHTAIPMKLKETVQQEQQLVSLDNAGLKPEGIAGHADSEMTPLDATETSNGTARVEAHTNSSDEEENRLATQVERTHEGPKNSRPAQQDSSTSVAGSLTPAGSDEDTPQAEAEAESSGDDDDMPLQALRSSLGSSTPSEGGQRPPRLSINTPAPSRPTSAYYSASSSPIDASRAVSSMLSPSPVSPTFSAASTSSSFGNSGPLRSAGHSVNSGTSPRNLCFGARLCLEMTISKLRLESPNSGNPALLPERLNTPLGRAYPSSPCRVGQLGREGKGFISLALQRTRVLRRLETRRLTLLEEVELDGFKKSLPPIPLTSGETTPTIARSPSSVLPSHRAVANIASKALATALGDDRAAVPQVSAVAAPDNRVSGGAVSFQHFQEAAWRKWVERPTFGQRCDVTTADGESYAVSLAGSAGPRVAEKSLGLSLRARSLAGLSASEQLGAFDAGTEGKTNKTGVIGTVEQMFMGSGSRDEHLPAIGRHQNPTSDPASGWQANPPRSQREDQSAKVSRQKRVNESTTNSTASHATVAPAAAARIIEMLPRRTSSDRTGGGGELESHSSESTGQDVPTTMNCRTSSSHQSCTCTSPLDRDSSEQVVESKMLFKRRKSTGNAPESAAGGVGYRGPSSTVTATAPKLEKKGSLFSRAFSRSSSSRKSQSTGTKSATAGPGHQDPYSQDVKYEIDVREARPPRELEPTRTRSQMSALSPTVSSISLNSSSEAGLPAPTFIRPSVHSATSDTTRRHTLMLSPGSEHPQPRVLAGQFQRPISQVVIPSSNSEPNLFESSQHLAPPRPSVHARGASSPSTVRRHSAEPSSGSDSAGSLPKPALRLRATPTPSSNDDDEDEDLPLAVLQSAKRQSVASSPVSKPARVVSFHEDASRPPTLRQSSLPPTSSSTRNRLSQISSRPGDRRSTLLIGSDRPVSLALSDYAAEELHRLQEEVSTLRRQQKEAEEMKREFEALKVAEYRRSQVGEMTNWATLKAKEEEEAQKRKEERKRWEDHRRRSAHLDDLQKYQQRLEANSHSTVVAPNARPSLPQSFSAPQLVSPQPIYPQPFVHPGFMAAYSGASSPMAPYYSSPAIAGASGHLHQQQQNVHLQPISMPYTMIPTPPAAPPHYPPASMSSRRDSPARTRSGHESGASSPGGVVPAGSRASGYFPTPATPANSVSRSQPGSDAFLAYAQAQAHAQAQAQPMGSNRSISMYAAAAPSMGDLAGWSNPTESSGRGRSSLPAAGYRGSMMLGNGTAGGGQIWQSALPRSENADQLALHQHHQQQQQQQYRQSVMLNPGQTSSAQKRQSQMWT